MRRLFEGGACSSNYCNWQLKSLLHLGQIVITFRTLLHLGLLRSTEIYGYFIPALFLVEVRRSILVVSAFL